MYKLGSLQGEQWQAHNYQRCFTLQNLEQSRSRLMATMGDDAVAIFEKVALKLTPPYGLLYVLHTPRGEGEEGRYQSPWLKASELCRLLHKYESYFKTDSRFDIWIHSPADAATLVWDRHNLLYGYGPLDLYTTALTEEGYLPGDVSLPDPHQHNYYDANDSEAVSLLDEVDWTRSDLRPEDEQ